VGYVVTDAPLTTQVTSIYYLVAARQLVISIDLIGY